MAQGPDVKETATGPLLGNTRESESAIDDCRGSCDTEPTKRLPPAARATDCVSCTAEADGVGADAPGAKLHSSQGNTIVMDVQIEEAAGQPVVERDASGKGTAQGRAACEMSLRTKTIENSLLAESSVKLQNVSKRGADEYTRGTGEVLDMGPKIRPDATRPPRSSGDGGRSKRDCENTARG